MCCWTLQVGTTIFLRAWYAIPSADLADGFRSLPLAVSMASDSNAQLSRRSLLQGKLFLKRFQVPVSESFETLALEPEQEHGETQPVLYDLGTSQL